MDKVPTPKEFLPHPGNPVLPFKHWIRLFDNYIFMSNASRSDENKMNDEAKNRFLFTLLGFEAIRIFSSTPECDKISSSTHEDFKKAVKELFDTPVNPFKAYYDFENRNQHSHETTQEYLTALRSLMSDCDFAGRENHHLAIRLACGCFNKDTQKKLLALPNVNLDEVLRIMKAEELANESVTAITGQAAVHGTKVGHRTKTPRRSQPKSAPSDSCTRCGYGNHLTSDTCPALGAKCNLCGKLNHFSKVCRSSRSGDKNKGVKTVNVRTVNSGSPFNYTIQLVKSDNTKVPLTAEVDTGSQITGVTLEFYRRHFSTKKLRVPLKLRNFDNTELPRSHGRFTTTVSDGDKSADIEFHVLPSPCFPVIGQDAIHALKLNINGENMSVHSVSKTTDILKEYPNLLSNKLGKYPDFQHKITTSADITPKCQKLRPVALARRDTASKEIDKMDDLGIWEPVDKSLWAHHMVTVPKADGGLRVTTDLSPLNNFVIPDRYPLPNPKDLFLELKGAKVFTKLDLRKAFFHVELHPDSRHLTTTLTQKGLRQYKRLPMGLTDSASVCQRLVAQTLADCPGTIAYVDDILVFGSSQKEHDHNLHKALARLEAKDFRLQLSKCHISVSEIQFLGHVISAAGIRPNTSNVEAIQNAPTPCTLKQVQSFLGMVNYYCEFVPHMATIAEPLNKLQRKNVKFSWTHECQRAFSKLKSAIAKGVKNFIFDPNAPTFVTVDASDVGLGAMLSQIQHGKEVPIAHASHTLQPRERAYAVNEKEALACVWACETWDKYLLGRPFILRTDHASLTTLLQSTTDSRKSAKFCRWIDRLAAFDFKVVYTEGSRNVVADALSRLSVKSTAPAIRDHVESATVRHLQQDGLTLEAIQKATTKDYTLTKVISYVVDRWPAKKKLSPGFTPYFNIKDELSVEDGYILRSERIVLPATMKKQVLVKAHEGHPGIVRMKRQLRKSYWWPGQDRDIEQFCKHCNGCQRSDKSVPPINVKPTTVPVPTKPWQKLAIDITGPFLIAPQHSKFIVVLMDYHSKFPEILMTPTVTSEKIIAWLDEIFARYGLPSQLVSDNGPSFVSEKFKTYLQENNIQHIRTSVYNPQENGLVERFNQYLKTHIQAFYASNEPWIQGINALLRHFRATSPTAEGSSPCELMFARSMRLPHEVPHTQTQKHAQNEPNSAIAPKIQPVIRCRGPYNVGDTVLTRRPQVLKGQSPWSEPLKVTVVLGNYTYRLSDGQTWNARKLRRFLEPDLIWENAASAPAVHHAPPLAPTEANQRRSERSNRGVPPLWYPP